MITRSLGCALLAAVCCVASAQPLAQVERGGVRIVLYEEPCALHHLVTNLPRRAEWTAVGRVFQGCWVMSPFGIVVMLFDDLTVSAIPAQLFTPVREI